MLEADGRGSVVSVTAEGAAERTRVHLCSGSDLVGMNSGVYLARTARNALVEGNRIEGNLFGVYVHGAAGAVVRGNVIAGRRDARLAERGNGVTVWNAPGARVEGNDVRHGRDGIFVTASRNNVFAYNRFRDLRFAVHYMYSNDCEVRGNASFGNQVGYAIMYSQRLRVTGNLSDGDRDHGLLSTTRTSRDPRQPCARPAATSDGRTWRCRGPRAWRPSPSPRTAARGPANASSSTTPTATASSATVSRLRHRGALHRRIGGQHHRRQRLHRHRTQVKYVGTRHHDWSRDGRGNYWSDNPAFDLDRDGIADAAYRPNDLVDRVLWTAPRAKILLNSPAVQMLRWAQSQFPAILPGGVVDSHPLAVPPPPPVVAPRWLP